MRHFHDEGDRSRFYRDSERGVILGVCAGIAEYFDWPVWLVRAVTLGLGWFFTIPVIIAYVAAALIAPERPLRYYGDDERSFWQSRKHRS